MQYINKKNLKIFAKRVEELRKKANKSINKIALESGTITPATWCRVEQAKYDLKLSTMIKIASAFNMSLVELIEDLEFDYSIEE